MNLKNFLKGIPNALKAEGKKIHYCIGNEAADADSIVSALCYSYFRHLTATDYEIVYCPLVCIPQRDLKLRRDVEVLLQRVDLSYDNLISYEKCWVDGAPSGDVTFSLTDHNALSTKIIEAVGRDGASIKVTDILDHHADMEMHQECQGPHRNIAFNYEFCRPEVGSACTLIYEIFSQHQKDALQDSALSGVLMGVIALDTFSMDPTIAKGTPRDATALDDLAKISALSREILFEELKNAKLDVTFWRSLSASDCFRLDYKQYTDKKETEIFNYGVSSVLLSVNEILDKADVISSVQRYLDEPMDMLIALSFVDKPEPRRDMVVFTKSSKLLKDLEEFLEGMDDSPFKVMESNKEVEEHALGVGIEILSLIVTDVKLSRKQLAPYLSKFFTTSTSPDTVESMLGPVHDFLAHAIERIESLGLPVHGYEIDHLCYRAKDNEEYLRLLKVIKIGNYGEVIVESMIGGRPISVIALNKPIEFKEWKIPCLELACPKKGAGHKSGLEHVEIFVDLNNAEGFHNNKKFLEDFASKYDGITFDRKAVDKHINADLSVDLGEFVDPSSLSRNGRISVKYHARPLYEVCEYEKASLGDQFPRVPDDYFN